MDVLSGGWRPEPTQGGTRLARPTARGTPFGLGPASTVDSMLGPSFRLPHLSAPDDAPESMGDALVRAIAAADGVGGAFAASPCSFHEVKLSNTHDAVLWVLVTYARSAEADHEAHLRERSRTAVQRFMLSLQYEDVDAVWVKDDDALQAAFEGAGLDGDQAVPMGLVRCARLL